MAVHLSATCYMMNFTHDVDVPALGNFASSRYTDVHEQWCCRVLRNKVGQTLCCSRREASRSASLSNGVGRRAVSRKSILR